MQEFLLAVMGAIGIGAFYIFILYNTYDVTYTRSKLILRLVSIGMAVPLAMEVFYSFIPMHQVSFGNYWIDEFFSSVMVAPVMEESFKLWIFYLLVFRHKPHMGPFEGMFSFALIGLGFAIVENCEYIISDLLSSGEDSLGYAGIMFARSFPGHELFNGIAGYWIGLAGLEFYEYEQKKGKLRPSLIKPPDLDWNLIAKGYGIALAAHAIWNFLPFLAFGTVFSIPILLLMVFFCYRLYRKYLQASKPETPEKKAVSYCDMLAANRREMKEARIAREKDLEHLLLRTIPAITALAVLCLLAVAGIRNLEALIWGGA